MGEQSDRLYRRTREELVALSEDVPALWDHPEAPVQLKKRILRTVSGRDRGRQRERVPPSSPALGGRRSYRATRAQQRDNIGAVQIGR